MKFLSLFLILLPLSFGYHDYYISLTEMEYNPQNATLEISIRAFTEDLEFALEESTLLDLELNSEREHPQATYYLGEYFKKHFEINQNDSPKKYRILGHEYEGEATWTYIEVEKIQEEDLNFSIRNSLLMDYFEEQTNMINFKINKKTKGAILSKGNSSFEVSF